MPQGGDEVIDTLEQHQGSDGKNQKETIEPVLRRSSRTAKPKEVFTYLHPGQPVYQQWKPGVYAVVSDPRYQAGTYLTVPGTYQYPGLVVLSS